MLKMSLWAVRSEPMIPVGVASLMLLAFGGCVSERITEQAAPAYKNTAGTTNSIFSAPLCCASMAAFRFIPMPLPASLVTHIDGTCQAYQFPRGKSFFLAYQLPARSGDVSLTIKSYFSGSVFFPNMLFLDDKYAPIRQIGAADTHYVPPGWVERGHYELSTTLGAQDPARYVVILTTDEAMSGGHVSKDSHTMLAVGGAFFTVPTGPYTNPHGPTGKIQLVVAPVIK